MKQKRIFFRTRKCNHKNKKAMEEKKQKVNVEAIKMQIVSKFTKMGKGQFVGFSKYENRNGEIANHIVNCNFYYEKAKKEDYEVKLSNMTEEQAKHIVSFLNEKDDMIKEENTSVEEVMTVKDSMLDRYYNPKKKTQKQLDAYTNIEGTTLKIHNDTGKVHAYALAVSKTVLQEGEYKKVNSRRNTRIQNAIIKELDFTTAKFRQFIVDPDNVEKVSLTGETLSFFE